MADFIAAIKPRKSSVAGEAPAPNDLEVAEIAVNTADGKLFTRHTDGTIKTIVGAAGEAGIADGSTRINLQTIQTTLTFTQTSTHSIPGSGRSGQLLSASCNVTSRVAFYTTAAARDNDVTRLANNDPETGVEGLIAQVSFSGGETHEFINTLYNNNDPSQSAVLYMTVYKGSAGTEVVEVDVRVIPIEGRALYEAQGSTRIGTPTVETSALAATASENLTLPHTARSGQFISVETSHSARVIFYSNQAARTADANRAQGEAIVAGNGVIMELITTGAQTLEMTPAVLYHNTEPNAPGEIYLKVTNLSGSTQAITVTATIVPIEGRGHYLSELHELLDVDASSPTNGQVIAYNTTSDKWEAVDQTAGGARIQDLQDFEYHYNATTFSLTSQKTTYGQPSVDGQWKRLNGSAFLAVDSSGELDKLAIGDTVTIYGDGFGPVTRTLTHFDNTNYAPAVWIESSPTGWGDTAWNSYSGDALHLVSSAFNDSPVPLADGDLIAWDSSEGKFMPTQPALGRFDVDLAEASLVTNGTADIAGTGLGASGMIHSVEAGKDCVVTFYSSTAARLADASRDPLTTSPSNSDGVLLEVRPPVPGDVLRITPAVSFFIENGETTVSIKVKGLDSSSGSSDYDVNVKGISFE